MTHSYELNDDDIRKIIAEKFNCGPECVCLRKEKEHVLGGSIETIKATIRMKDG